MGTCAILITNYNYGPYLRQCIDSALEQTRKADEVIVYDDGSTDSSREIIASYGTKIRPIYAPHFSPNGRNNLIHAVNEEYFSSHSDCIFLLDGDDAFLPRKIEVCMGAFETNPGALLIQSPLVYIDKNGNRNGGMIRHEWTHHVDVHERVRRTRDLDYFYPTSALAIRSEFLLKIMPLRLERYPLMSPDIAFCINAVIRGRVLTLDEPLTLYRLHSANMSRRFLKPFYRMRFDFQINRYHNDRASMIDQPPLRLWMNRKFMSRSVDHVLRLLCGRVR